jgi:hypothetical protein
LEDWIGKRVTVNLDRGPVKRTDPDNPIVAIEGFLQGVDPMGVIVLFDPQDVSGRQGRARPRPDMSPRYVFYPWRRVELIERIEQTDE